MDDKAHRLIITLKFHMSNEGGGVSQGKDGKEVQFQAKIDANHPAKGEETLDSIIIDLNK